MFIAIKSILFLLLLEYQLFAQLSLGQWREHLPFLNATCITQSPDEVYCAFNSGLVVYNKKNGTFEKLSKTNGLSDVGISAINYDNSNKLLVIGYSNGNIDIIKDHTIYNLPDIKRKQMVGFKTINNIFFIGQKAYLSCAFGIVVLNSDRIEIGETYYIGENGAKIEVFDIAFDGTYIHAATINGIYKANIRRC